jgi:AcrR family transcriptional regulator
MNIKYIHSYGGSCLIDKKDEVFSAARKLFASKGFKDTNISDIAKKAGIAVGSFYKYFSSKEEIFLKVYLKENEELKMRMFKSFNMNDDPVTMVTNLVSQNAVEMNSNRILKEWYNKELFAKLEKLFYEQDGFKSIEEMMNSGMAGMVKKWKAEGKVRQDLDDEMIIAIFKAIPFIDLHKSEIGIKYFPQILFYITEFVMKGITGNRK